MTHFTAPAFIRSVARFTDRETAAPPRAFSETLTHWLHWTDAGDLAAALEGDPAEARSTRRRGGAVGADDLGKEVEAFRESMRTALAQDLATASATTPRARQQSMETGVAALRARLRAALSAQSPEMARLAAIDAVMERVLAPRERGLLARVPVGLAPHSDGLHDMLRAELDLRLQPVEGLLAALEAAQAGRPSPASSAGVAPTAVRAASGPAPGLGRASRPARN